MVLAYPWGAGVIIDLGVKKLAIDAPKPVPGAYHVLTHAHADHTGAAKRVLSLTSRETHEILRALGGFQTTVLPYGATETVADADVSFISAGHIPGSVQVVIDSGRRIVVTGDWKLESDILQPGAEVPEDVDVLFLETTFGAPQYQFPARKEVYPELLRWVKANLGIGNHVVLFGYAVGKSQELTALMNSADIVPIVPERTHRVNALFGLKDVLIGSEGWREYASAPRVFIMPPNYADLLPALEVELRRRIVAKSCSGWAKTGFRLSSHADFWQTIDFVARVEPKLVFTYGGNALQMAAVLKRQGFNAQPLLRSSWF